MIHEYHMHNLFWESVDAFLVGDPYLRRLRAFTYVHPLDWWHTLSFAHGGVYILSGGRQVGKSTSTKLLFKYLLVQQHWSPGSLFYVPCDQLVDRFHLLRVVKAFLETLNRDTPFCLVVDEVTFIKDWSLTIKALADEGHFEKGICIVTGSDRILLDEAASSFPGRRGPAKQADFVLYPLSFREFLKLTRISSLSEAFKGYLHTGGYLVAINDWFIQGAIQEATYRTYQQWIVGDFIKRERKPDYLKDVLASIVSTLTSQVTFSTLARKTTSMRVDTLMEYCHMLERMGVIFIQHAFDQNHLGPFPKKAKKIHFQDPFIALAVVRWLKEEWRLGIETIPESYLVEGIVVTHFGRHYPTYYIKAEGEVDVVIVKDKTFFPMEVKWTSQLRSRDLAQIQKYKNGVILTSQDDMTTYHGISAKSLLQVLADT